MPRAPKLTQKDHQQVQQQAEEIRLPQTRLGALEQLCSKAPPMQSEYGSSVLHEQKEEFQRCVRNIQVAPFPFWF
jgi:hypothetical protein